MPLLAVISDTHIGSTTGLCPPHAMLDDGGQYTPSRQQRELWRAWLDFWSWVAENKGAEPLTVVSNGDIGEIDAKGRSHQLITRNKATVLRLCLDALEPALSIADRAVFIRGTGAHSGKSAWLEEEIARDCDIATGPSKEQASWWQLSAKHHKTTILIKHTGPAPGRTRRNYLTPLLAYAHDLTYYSALRPTLSIAGHNHRHADTGDAYPCRHIAAPCWQLPNEYSHGKAWIEGPSIGGLLVRVDDRGYTLQVKRYEMRQERAIDL